MNSLINHLAFHASVAFINVYKIARIGGYVYLCFIAISWKNNEKID